MELNNYLLSWRLLWSKAERFLYLGAEGTILLSSLASLFLLIYQFGFDYSEHTATFLFHGRVTLLLSFFIGLTLRYLLRFKEIILEKMIYMDVFIYFSLFTVLSCKLFFKTQINEYLPYLSFFDKPIFTYVLLFLLSIIHLSRQVFTLLQTHVKPTILFVLSFAIVICIGSGLLMLPNATKDPIHFIDALFTATTSVCVTGLTTVDVASTFTTSGLVIILLLIQIGGIGVMTFTSFFALSFMSSSSFNSRLILKDMLNEDKINGLFRIIVNIIFVTFFIESIGVYLIYTSVAGTFPGGFREEIFYAVFNSISAFCNAGISTLSNNMYDPLVASNALLHVWVAFLIIFGGLGFPIVFNYLKLFRHYIINTFRVIFMGQKQYVHIARIININTYIVIAGTLILVIGGTFLYMILEWNHTLKELPASLKIANSFLGAVTPRTAGFNVADMSLLAPSTLMFTLILMVIGGAPMSTAGGIKITAAWVSVQATWDALRNKENIEIRKREIASKTIRKAFVTIVLYFLWIAFVVFLLSITEKDVPLFTLLFESISALSTVGLSLNYTPLLSESGKLLIILTMFVGRIGIFTFFLSFLKDYPRKNYSYPQENILM